MLRPLKQRVRDPPLHNPPVPHDDHVVRNLTRHREIVRQQHVRHRGLLAQLRAWIDTSSADTASSRITSYGSTASALVIAAR